MAANYLSNLVGSFASPAAENPTVAIMEAAFQHHELDWRYLNCLVEPENLEGAVNGAWAMGWQGFNCSLPHKIDVIKHIERLGESAAIIGAVNTMIRTETGFVGENTDGRGFVTAIRALTDLDKKRVVMFGAGGAARALAVELSLAGIAELNIVNRSESRGRKLESLINAKTHARALFHPWRSAFSIPPDTDIVVNATSIGLHPNVDQELDVAWDSLRPEMIVADGVHNPPMTGLLRHANDIGCPTLNGIDMLVNVCAICIELWTGVDVERDVMRDAVSELLHAEQSPADKTQGANA
jgi:shikimate dehydrogenase